MQRLKDVLDLWLLHFTLKQSESRKSLIWKLMCSDSIVEYRVLYGEYLPRNMRRPTKHSAVPPETGHTQNPHIQHTSWSSTQKPPHTWSNLVAKRLREVTIPPFGPSPYLMLHLGKQMVTQSPEVIFVTSDNRCTLDTLRSRHNIPNTRLIHVCKSFSRVTNPLLPKQVWLAEGRGAAWLLLAICALTAQEPVLTHNTLFITTLNTQTFSSGPY